jgi:hypothetical protein
MTNATCRCAVRARALNVLARSLSSALQAPHPCSTAILPRSLDAPRAAGSGTRAQRFRTAHRLPHGASAARGPVPGLEPPALRNGR